MKNYYKDAYIDQYKNVFFASTLRELREKIPGRISKMYEDFEGKTFHVGYVIGHHWLTKFNATIREVRPWKKN